MPEFIENSVTCTFIRRAYSGSRVVKLTESLGSRLTGLVGCFYRGTARVVDGSWIIGLFRVNDYLDIDRSSVWSVFWGSRTTRALDRLARQALGRATRIWEAFFRQESVLSWVLDRVYFFRRPGFSLRNRLILVLAFLVGFYAARQIAMILIPGANLLSPWSAGLCLALLLIGVLYKLNDRHQGQEEQVAKARGLLQWLWLALCWFPCRIAPVARHLKVVCRKIVFGAAPPIEGGDV